MLLEVCCGSVKHAVSAAQAGAQRVELCDNLVEGGTTPSSGMIRLSVETVKVPVMVMIRPRGGDFLYTDLEFEVMLRDIANVKNSGANGVVFGILNPDGTIDMERSSRLVDAARPLQVTFHRAFDVTRDLIESLDTLCEMAVDRVLTSAGSACLRQALPLLSELVVAGGDSIKIMGCGGVEPSHVDELLVATGITELHVGATRSVESQMQYQVNNLFMGRSHRPDEYVLEEVDMEFVERMSDVLSGYTG